MTRFDSSTTPTTNPNTKRILQLSLSIKSSAITLLLRLAVRSCGTLPQPPRLRSRSHLHLPVVRLPPFHHPIFPPPYIVRGKFSLGPYGGTDGEGGGRTGSGKGMRGWRESRGPEPTQLGSPLFFPSGGMYIMFFFFFS